jgi:hypothetical protein
MHRLGSSLLEKLLALDEGHRGQKIDCGAGHEAEFVGYREKYLTTVLGSLGLRRAYYHCPKCGKGVVPKDQELDVVGSSYSPGVRRMLAHTGSQEPFAHASRDLDELAGLSIPAKQVERVAEARGDRLKTQAEGELEDYLLGRVLPLPPPSPIPTLYVTVDGQGVPTVPKETAGRRGKAPDGRARTREAKLACVFTQTTQDERGQPVRDPGSSSYLAVIESADKFGQLTYAEALRRGLTHAQKVVIIGDGAPWIWNLANEHFPGAIQVVDVYHAREHLALVANTTLSTNQRLRRKWLAARTTEIDRGDVITVLRQLKNLGGDKPQTDVLRRALSYFETNRHRMRYGYFRRLGTFVGSGVVEAGCKTIVHQRLKQSGMRWTVRGAESVIWLRCCNQSSRWEEFLGASQTA